MEVNCHQSLISGPRLWERLVCECDLCARIYGTHSTHRLFEFADILEPVAHIPVWAISGIYYLLK